MKRVHPNQRHGAGGRILFMKGKGSCCLTAVLFLVICASAYPAVSHASPTDDLLAIVQSGWNKDISRIQTLIDQGADVNARNKYGDTPLVIAARNGSNETVKALLAGGADVNIKSQNGWAPILHASQRIHNNNNPHLSIEIINALIDKGADVDARTNSGETSIFLSAWNGDVTIVNALLARGANVDVKMQNGETPLIRTVHANVSKYRNDVIKTLIAHGADVNARTDTKISDGYAPLIFAAWNGNTEIVLLLLEKGADVNARTREGKTPLYFAAGQGKGFPEIVAALLAKGAAVNTVATGDSGKTALIVAANNGNTDIAGMLLDKGADLSIKSKEDSRTALLYASENGRSETVRLLLDRGAVLNSNNGYGETPLMLAVTSNHTRGRSEHQAAGSGDPVDPRLAQRQYRNRQRSAGQKSGNRRGIADRKDRPHHRLGDGQTSRHQGASGSRRQDQCPKQKPRGDGPDVRLPVE
jgi:ankyrin repeat protein